MALLSRTETEFVAMCDAGYDDRVGGGDHGRFRVCGDR